MSCFDEGILVWVDDDFHHAEFFGKGSDIDVWSRIFGRGETGFPWLLDLKLVPIEDSDKAIDSADTLGGGEYLNAYIQAVLDMRIPRRIGRAPEKKFGLKTAVKYRDAGIDFCILSSKTDAQAELADHNLQGTPYYNKLPAPSATMMPEDLARRLLQSFKTNITWIKLSKITRKWVNASELQHPLKTAHRGADFFPFFAGCREFIERWEMRQSIMRRGLLPRVVLRAAESHSDEFIAQCCAIIIAGRNPALEYRVLYTRCDGSSVYSVLDRKADAKIIRVLGRDSEQVEAEIRVIRHALSIRQIGEQLIFVLPHDEFAEPFLDFFSGERDVIFDDLPTIHAGSVAERELYVRNIVEYHLSRMDISLEGDESAKVHAFYRTHPETLFHPLFWTFLLESDVVASEFTDPYELQVAVLNSLEAIEDWPGSAKRCLVDGRALPMELLLKPASEIFEASAQLQPEWATTAYRDWLVKSWQTPYGCIDVRREDISNEEIREWERLCLQLALELAQSYKALVMDAGGETDPVLSQATNFMLTDAVFSLIQGEGGKWDWSALEAFRWPHAECPMPSALNQRLKQEGRYLFVQTDLLDRVVYTHSGTEKLLRIEEYAERQAQRLQLIEDSIDHLPLGWSKSVKRILQQIYAGRFTGHADRTDKIDADIWTPVLSLSKNATITSYVFHAAVSGNGFLTEKRLNMLRGGSGKGASGEGLLLSFVRAHRSAALNGVLCPRFPNSALIQRDLRRLRDVSSSLIQLIDHGEGRHGAALQAAMDELIRILAELDVGRVATIDDTKRGLALARAIQKMMPVAFEKFSALQSNGFFDSNLVLSSDLAHLPISDGAMRGTGFDLLLHLCEWADLASWTLSPLQYSDGYHFLASIRDQRNTLKDSVPSMRMSKMSKCIDLFMYGFAGLVAQLCYCLRLLGETDKAHALSFGDYGPAMKKAADELKGPTNLDTVMRVRHLDDGGYELFQTGYAGSGSQVYSYVDADGSIVQES